MYIKYLKQLYTNYILELLAYFICIAILGDLYTYYLSF